MSTIIGLFLNLWNAMACVGELLGYVLRFVSAFFQTRASLAARLVAAESQLGICKRRTEQKGSPRFRFTAGFRLLGRPVQVLGALAGGCSVDAAGDGQGLAHPRLQNLLAVEVPKEARKASHHPGDAGADLKAQF
jgi:hypothetical protein